MTPPSRDDLADAEGRSHGELLLLVMGLVPVALRGVGGADIRGRRSGWRAGSQSWRGSGRQAGAGSQSGWWAAGSR